MTQSESREANTHHPKKVSLIIRCFNEERYIGGLLKRIKQQKIDLPVEIVVIDSGSTDKTLEIVDKFDVILVKITPEEFTFGKSLNWAIKAASGDICVNISAHCWPRDNSWLKNIVSPFYKSNQALVYGRQIGGPRTKFSEEMIFAKWFPIENILGHDVPFCNNANSAIRKSLWEKYPFDETLTALEDIDWGKFVRSAGYSIDYRADACVYHFHDEKVKQIYHRYYREALAYKNIFKDEYFSFFDFLKFFFLNILSDYYQAIRQKKFFKNLYWIPMYRFLQFYSTYKAHSFKVPMNANLKRRMYYPNRLKKKKWESFEKVVHEDFLQDSKDLLGKFSQIFDVSRTLDESLPVWPGAPKFQRQVTKTIDGHDCFESNITLNIHTGTHVDAPKHFMRDGKSVDELDMKILIGEVEVLEYLGEDKAIKRDFFKDWKKIKAKDQSQKKRVFIKTKNSGARSGKFDKNFVALESDAAKFLADEGVQLIGVDGPSVQLFADLNNDTHKHLLDKNIIIVEGLDLSSVSAGNYEMFCAPLKIAGAEGAPARVILRK